MEQVKPITPQDAFTKQQDSIDPLLISIVNDFLSKEFSSLNSEVKIKLKDIKSEYFKRGGSLSEEELSNRKQFDFEDLYRKVGWSVSYDKPGYNENYDSFFIFKQKK